MTNKNQVIEIKEGFKTNIRSFKAGEKFQVFIPGNEKANATLIKLGKTGKVLSTNNIKNFAHLNEISIEKLNEEGKLIIK